jgi:hypothetical protein
MMPPAKVTGQASHTRRLKRQHAEEWQAALGFRVKLFTRDFEGLSKLLPHRWPFVLTRAT